MCLWLITACLGLLPTSPQTNIVIAPGLTPIVQPTTVAVTTAPPIFTVPTTVATVATPMIPPMMTGNIPQMTVVTNPPPVATMPATNPTVVSTAVTNPPPMIPVTAPNPPPVIPVTAPNPPPVIPVTAPNPPPVIPVTAPNPPPVIPVTAPNPPPVVTMTATNPPMATTSATIVQQVPTNTGGFLPVLICNNPNVVCAAYPNQIATGNPLIDPRLGMIPQLSRPYQAQAPAITAYNAILPPSDSAVKFPVQKRSVDNIYQEQRTLFNVLHKIRKRQTVSPCACVAAGTCVGTNAAANPVIDFRIVTPTCPPGHVYCCGGTSTTPTLSCGVKQYVGATTTPTINGQAPFGAYPWMGMILTTTNAYVAGAVLVDQRHVITVIHRIQPYIVSGTAPSLKIRLGEWNSAATTEAIPYQEYTVSRVFTHPSYNGGTLQYDIAVLRLATTVPLSPMTGSVTTINRACLPASAASAYTNQRCWVAGWGKNAFGTSGQYQQILKEVDVPIVDPTTCQTQLRTARLGASYVLDTTSFICAGGEANKDSCTGDGGSGLFCQVNNQWMVVGLVAWGLGCASASVPGVYVNVATLLPWIQTQIATV